MARLTIQFAGFELDVTFGIAGAEAEDDDPAAALNGGTTQGYFMAPVVRPEMPDEAAIHRPTSPWEDDSEARAARTDAT